MGVLLKNYVLLHFGIVVFVVFEDMRESLKLYHTKSSHLNEAQANSNETP